MRRSQQSWGSEIGGESTLEITIEERSLVPGDILILLPGNMIPADCVIIYASSLQVSQSSLTGESEPVRRSAVPQPKTTSGNFFDLQNIAFMGTSVVSGTEIAVVFGTGEG